MLVLNTLVNQVKFSTENFSKSQENELMERIKIKINPFDLKINQLKQYLIAAKTNDENIKKILLQSKAEIMNNIKERPKPEGLYDFSVYNVNITNELLEVLTNEQFIDYKNYYDLMHPIIENLNTYNNYKYRYGYAKDIFNKARTLKPNSFSEYKDYEDKILIECGCAFDKTIKRELIIR